MATEGLDPAGCLSLILLRVISYRVIPVCESRHSQVPLYFSTLWEAGKRDSTCRGKLTATFNHSRQHADTMLFIFRTKALPPSQQCMTEGYCRYSIRTMTLRPHGIEFPVLVKPRVFSVDSQLHIEGCVAHFAFCPRLAQRKVIVGQASAVL